VKKTKQQDGNRSPKEEGPVHLEEYSKLNNKVSPETVLSIMNIDDPDQLADIITAT